MTVRNLICALLVCLPLGAQTRTAAELGRAVLAAGLDPNECYRIRDVEISEEDIRIFLSDGYLTFGRAVEGEPLSAVFSADTEGGDGEILMLPPSVAERKSMAAYTGSPNLNEHFTQAAFIFTEAGARALLTKVRHSDARKAPDIGAIMVDRWSRVVANVMGSFESRIVLDLLTPGQKSGFFEAAIQGNRRGDFDVLYDSRGYEQIVAGQITTRNGVEWWDTWASFAGRDHRGQPAPEPEEDILSYRIETDMDAAFNMRCLTRIRVRAKEDSRNLLAFDLSGRMHATSAKVDGVPAEVYERASVRGGLVQNSGNELLLVLPKTPLEPGTEHEIEIAHEGRVVEDAGRQVYYVSARGTWYPGRGLQFAKYDATWHYPASLQLVSPGAVTEDRTEGDVRTTHRVPEGPLRLLGFNLGAYERKDSARSGIAVEVLANQQLEDALRPKTPETVSASDTLTPRRRQGPTTGLDTSTPLTLIPHPGDQLARIADEVEDCMAWYQTRFGDPPLKSLAVSPVPGNFGQGFGGMIYLPTSNYVMADHTSANPNQGLFRDLLLAHEAAHQWWGNVVATLSYHQEWLMEAIANYSAMMYLESKQGPKAMETMLDYYRKGLFEKGPDGETAESEGPVVQGRRLESSNNPSAAVAVMYGKGSWVMHMLRRRMGDANFLKVLAEARRRYEWKPMDTEQFRLLCAEFLPPGGNDAKLENFFEQWVYGTGVPTLKLSFSVKGAAGSYKLTGTVTQTDAPEDFSAAVPVEIQTGRGKPVVQIVRTSSDEPVTFTVSVPGPSAKALLDPGWSVLRR